MKFGLRLRRNDILRIWFARPPECQPMRIMVSESFCALFGDFAKTNLAFRNRLFSCLLISLLPRCQLNTAQSSEHLCSDHINAFCMSSMDSAPSFYSGPSKCDGGNFFSPMMTASCSSAYRLISRDESILDACARSTAASFSLPANFFATDLNR